MLHSRAFLDSTYYCLKVLQKLRETIASHATPARHIGEHVFVLKWFFITSRIEKASDHGKSLWKHDLALLNTFQVDCSFPCGSTILRKPKNSVFSLLLKMFPLNIKLTFYKSFSFTSFFFFCIKKKDSVFTFSTPRDGFQSLYCLVRTGI